MFETNYSSLDPMAFSTPAYGAFNANLTGASNTAGPASDDFLSGVIAGTRDFLGLTKEVAATLASVKASANGQTGAGANQPPVQVPIKKTIDPFLLIAGAFLFWISKNA